MKYTQRYDTVKGRGHRVVIQRMILPRQGQIYFSSVSSVRALSIAPEVPFPFRLPLSGWKVGWMAFVTRRGSLGGQWREISGSCSSSCVYVTPLLCSSNLPDRIAFICHIRPAERERTQRLLRDFL